MQKSQRETKRADLTIKEAAYLASVSYWWLWERVGKKDGPPFKRRGRLIILPRAEFLAWISQPEIN